MSTELVKQATVVNQLERVTDAELTKHLLNLGLLKDLTEGEKSTYLEICKAFNLNPFKREVHVSKYNGQMSIITGYETYIKRAERTGQLDGWSVTTSGGVESKDLKAVVTIHRKDRSHPFIWEADYNEYVQLTDEYKDGKKTGNLRPTKFWQKATTMIKKVAISQAFRLCFSDELGGMPYTSDEMPEKTEDVPHEEVKINTDALIKDQLLKDAIAGLESCSTEHELKMYKKTLSPEVIKHPDFVKAGKARYETIMATVVQ